MEHYDGKELVDPKKRRQLMIDFYYELDTCTEYGEAAVIGAIRQKIKKYKFDKDMGILEEEIILVTFLKEMQSSVRYLLTRLETDIQLDEFESQLEKSKGKTKPQRGFVDNLLDSLTNLKDSGKGEFEKIYQLIKHRYSIGNKLFSIICDLQKKNAMGNNSPSGI